jgi:hypothetical protein
MSFKRRELNKDGITQCKRTLARGARQFVVQLALETMSMLELYVFSFTPTTNIGASADGAEIMIFLAPAYMVEKDKLKLRFEGGKSKAKEN